MKRMVRDVWARSFDRVSRKEEKKQWPYEQSVKLVPMEFPVTEARILESIFAQSVLSFLSLPSQCSWNSSF
jgi:hypothetical protein